MHAISAPRREFGWTRIRAAPNEPTMGDRMVLTLYFATSDVAAAHKELDGKGVKVNKIMDDLHGPGSGVKWFNLEDPDGNQVLLVQE